MNIQYRNCDVATAYFQADQPIAFGGGFDVVALILPWRIDIRPRSQTGRHGSETVSRWTF
jgi:hypothetical protein